MGQFRLSYDRHFRLANIHWPADRETRNATTALAPVGAFWGFEKLRGSVRNSLIYDAIGVKPVPNEQSWQIRQIIENFKTISQAVSEIRLLLLLLCIQFMNY